MIFFFLLLLVASCLAGPVVVRPIPDSVSREVGLVPPLSRVVWRGDEVCVEYVGEGRCRQVEGSGYRSRFLLLGTDALGRDMVRRLMLGGRTSLFVTVLALVMGTVLGVGVGVAAGLGPRWLDALLMRLVDAMLAFPALFLLVALVAVLEPGPGALVVVMGSFSWMGLARLVRGQVGLLQSEPFMLASKGCGSSPFLVFRLHILRWLLRPVGQEAALRAADLVVAEATLSFLGLGIQPPSTSWGLMVSEARDLIPGGWWVLVAPAVSVALFSVLLVLGAWRLSERAEGLGT